MALRACDSCTGIHWINGATTGLRPLFQAPTTGHRSENATAPKRSPTQGPGDSLWSAERLSRGLGVQPPKMRGFVISAAPGSSRRSADQVARGLGRWWWDLVKSGEKWCGRLLRGRPPGDGGGRSRKGGGGGGGTGPPAFIRRSPGESAGTDARGRPVRRSGHGRAGCPMPAEAAITPPTGERQSEPDAGAAEREAEAARPGGGTMPTTLKYRQAPRGRGGP